MLIPFPFAFLTGAFVYDAAGRMADVPAWWTVGGHLAIAGITTALVAAIPGLVDYVYTVPPKSSGKTRATRHMAANLTAVALFTVAWWVRGGAASRPDVTVLGIEGIGLALLAAGGYMGGTLVTRNMIGIDHRYARAGKWVDRSVAAAKGREGITVARREELDVDQMKLLRVGDRRIALARTKDGYVAFDDRCTHRGGSLAGGVMVGGIVQCLWHGSQFNASTGKVQAGPAEKPVRVYEVREDRGEVKLIL
jgi:nitrite reductase/ring-hydroxylating ferredoxin subunit/uncharacterized membrane protein